MKTLHFCRDGILRRTFTCRDPEQNGDIRFNTRLIPVRAWEKSADPDIFLKTLHDSVMFEPGLTVGELFENLAPWADTMRAVACMDYPAFLIEMRNKDAKPAEDIEKITLGYLASIDAVPEFEREGPLFSGRVMNIGEPAYTGRLSLEEGWNMTALVKEEHRAEYDGADSVSLSFTPLSEWQHLPITIDTTGSLRDGTASPRAATHLGTDTPLTLADHKNVETVSSSTGDVFAHDVAIDVPCPTFLDTVIRGLLWDVGFHYSPVQRDDARDSVLQSVEELDLARENGEIDLDEPEDRGEIDAEEAGEIEMMKNLMKKSAEMGLQVNAPKTSDD